MDNNNVVFVQHKWINKCCLLLITTVWTDILVLITYTSQTINWEIVLQLLFRFQLVSTSYFIKIYSPCLWKESESKVAAIQWSEMYGMVSSDHSSSTTTKPRKTGSHSHYGQQQQQEQQQHRRRHRPPKPIYARFWDFMKQTWTGVKFALGNTIECLFIPKLFIYPI